MMENSIEILKFSKTEGTKHIGIIHVRLFKQIIIRYKVFERDNNEYFAAPPAYKNEDNEKWVPWFMLDSQFFKEEVVEKILDYIRKNFDNNVNTDTVKVDNF